MRLQKKTEWKLNQNVFVQLNVFVQSKQLQLIIFSLSKQEPVKCVADEIAGQQPRFTFVSTVEEDSFGIVYRKLNNFFL